MYAVNGIPLDNPNFGWEFLAPSKPLSEFTIALESITLPGRDGVEPLPGRVEAPVLPMVVRTPSAHKETLVALFSAPGRILTIAGDASRSVEFELMAVTNSRLVAADAVIDMTFAIRLSRVYWRDTLETTSPPVSLASASQVVDVMLGLSQPVRDAIIRVKGQASGLIITDSSGAWVSYASAIPTGVNYWRFEAATGRAFTTTADVWTGGTEVTGQTDYSGTNYPFSIYPRFTDPAVRTGRLTVVTSARSGALIQVRGRRAYAFA